jgi:hypothetical protein
MDFEDPNLWVAFQPTKVDATTERVHGGQAVALSSFTWTRLDSALMSSPFQAKPFVALDLRIPSPQNQWWRGSLDLVASIPSLGVHDAPIGHLDLLNHPVDVFEKVVFPVPQDVQQALSGTFQDLTFSFVVNVPWGQTGAYGLDWLRFQSNATGGPERPPVTGDTPPPVAVAPPVPIPPLGGTGAAAIASAMVFVDWAMGARASQIGEARKVAKAAAGNAEIVQALIQQIDMLNLDGWLRYLVTMSVLGEMQTAAGADFFTSVVDLPLPAGADEVEGHRAKPAAFRLGALQIKAVDGLAFMRTTTSNAKLLSVIASHPLAAVRHEAIRAWLDNNGPTPELTAAVQPDDQIELDRFVSVSEKDPNFQFDNALAAYLAKHPSPGNPPNSTR